MLRKLLLQISFYNESIYKLVTSILPVQFGPPIEPATVKPAEGFTGIGLPENDIFYFHPDHLGSTSYITTRNGSISQHAGYIAFGEVLFEEHSSSFSSPYLFNGKELDRETNLSYYGARYLDMKTSLWLNVDPLAEKYQNVGGYTYCLNNPIKYIDPDGRWVKGAGFWRNMTSSDARIYAEDAAKNRPDAEVTKYSANKFSVQYMNLHDNGDVGYKTDYYNGKKSTAYKSVEIGVLKNSYSEMSSEPSFSDYLKNYSSAANMTSDWASGAGAKYRVFNNTSETRAMKNAIGVVAARNLFYSKNDPNASVTNFGASFGLSGLARAGLDATEQFIGSYSIEIHSNGKALQFSVFNTTSAQSAGYGIFPEYERSTMINGGNMRQLYIWTEPLNKE